MSRPRDASVSKVWKAWLELILPVGWALMLLLLFPLPVHAQSNDPGAHAAYLDAPRKSGSPLSNEAVVSDALDSLTQRFNEMEHNQQALEDRARQAESGQKVAEETLRVLRYQIDHTFNKIELIVTFIGGCIVGIFLMLLFRQRTPKRRVVTPRSAVETKPAPISASGLSHASNPSSTAPPSSPPTAPRQTPLPAHKQIGQIGPAKPEDTASTPLKGVQPLPQVPSGMAAPMMPVATAAERSQAEPDPVIELANIMVDLGLAQEAARDLVAYIHQQHSKNPLHWFKALEIYRELDQHAAFDKTSADLKQALNVAPYQWAPAADTRFLCNLEDYPHLIAKLQSLWHKPECKEFLRQLLEDNRQGQRSGFSRCVIEDIVLLSDLLKNDLPS